MDALSGCLFFYVTSMHVLVVDETFYLQQKRDQPNLQRFWTSEIAIKITSRGAWTFRSVLNILLSIFCEINSFIWQTLTNGYETTK